MDYNNKGGTGQGDSNEVFFTPGDGFLPPNMNGSGNSINDATINQDYASVNQEGINQGKIGNAALNSAENYEGPEKNVSAQENIIHDEVEPTAGAVSDESTQPNYDALSVIKTTKNSITPETKKVISRNISDFNKSGKAADFYDIARRSMIVNVEKSYNRIIAKGQA